MSRCMNSSIRCSSIRQLRCHSPGKQFYSQEANTISKQAQKNKKTPAKKEVIFSGIQPTGVPHLGNYLGAIRQWKEFQDERVKSGPDEDIKLYYSIVDLHALTATQNHEERLKLRKESFASLLAIGLDPKHSSIFYQSEIPAHSEMLWILSTVASTGYLSRMTQWKTKLDLSENASLGDDATTEKLKLGLFSYPVLQAADILLYRPSLIPVGEDQSQHIEFARSLARSFNAHYANRAYFSPPKAYISQAKRIMSLRDPNQKMSKSHADPKSRILITDSPDEITSKIKAAVTDSEEGISYDREKRPGVSNLVEILKHVSNNSADCEDIASEHQTLSMRAFKELVAEEIIKTFDGFRDRFFSIMDPKSHELNDAANDGRRKARTVAGSTMKDVRDIIGLSRL